MQNAIRILVALSLMSGVMLAVLKGVSLLLQWLGWNPGGDPLLGNE